MSTNAIDSRTTLSRKLRRFRPRRERASRPEKPRPRRKEGPPRPTRGSAAAGGRHVITSRVFAVVVPARDSA